MTNAQFAAALFPQHARSGADAVFRALDNADTEAAEVERLREENAGLRCRVDELEAENAELRESVEEYQWEDRGPKVVGND